jgi:hypothetical protein
VSVSAMTFLASYDRTSGAHFRLIMEHAFPCMDVGERYVRVSLAAQLAHVLAPGKARRGRKVCGGQDGQLGS